MDARTYLEQIGKLGDYIKECEREIERLRDDLESIKGISYDKDRVMASVASDTLANKIDRIKQLEDQMSDIMIKCAEERARIISQIRRVPNRVHMTLLLMRYVDLLKFEQIAIDMDYSYDRIVHIHKDALMSFESIYDI